MLRSVLLLSLFLALFFFHALYCTFRLHINVCSCSWPTRICDLVMRRPPCTAERSRAGAVQCRTLVRMRQYALRTAQLLACFCASFLWLHKHTDTHSCTQLHTCTVGLRRWGWIYVHRVEREWCAVHTSGLCVWYHFSLRSFAKYGGRYSVLSCVGIIYKICVIAKAEWVPTGVARDTLWEEKIAEAYMNREREKGRERDREREIERERERWYC